MFTALLISVLVGATLGTRFTVLIIIPTIVVTWGVVVCIESARNDDMWAIASMLIVVAVGLQFGYLGGIFTRFIVASVWAPRITGREAPQIPASS
jgi:hypothetical protein